MIAYLDSSVLLRVAFGQPPRLAEWDQLKVAVASELIRVECLRTIDRMRLGVPLEDRQVVIRREAVFELIEHLDLIPVEAAVLERAAEPFPTTLGTLDAIHLASALLWQRSEGRQFDCFLTHDEKLGRAALASGLRVRGCEPAAPLP